MLSCVVHLLAAGPNCGRRFLSKEDLLNTGFTTACFRSSGKRPVRRDSLMTCTRTGRCPSSVSFNKSVGSGSRHPRLPGSQHTVAVTVC